MRKTAAALFTALLITAAAGTISVNLANANPYIRDYVEEREMPAPEDTEPLAIPIFSPQNNTTYASKNVALIFNVSLPESIEFFWSLRLYYKASWQSNITSVDFHHYNAINLTDIPEGSHSLEIVASVKYTGYITHQELKQNIYLTTYYVSYRLTGSSTVYFSVVSPPRISILFLENKTFNTSNVALNFAANEPISKVTYSLDGHDNLTIAGNTTLSGLPSGLHNVMVYAWDAAGNVGASETVTFTVSEPESFPTIPVASVSAASIAVAAAGLLLIRKRHKGAAKT